ncbi:hypothetical protein GcM3_206033, partial [Golovinomyces cichoracearum]
HPYRKGYEEELHNRFQEDFQGFTREIFVKGNRDLYHELRSSLTRQEVYVQSNNKRIAKNLEIALSEVYQEWPQAEIERQNKTRGGFLHGSRYATVAASETCNQTKVTHFRKEYAAPPNPAFSPDAYETFEEFI